MTNTESDRIFVEERTFDIYQQLNASAGKNTSIFSQPFSEAKELFLWAVMLGVKEGKRRILDGKKKDLFFWNRLDPTTELTILDIISIAETNDVSIIEHIGEIQNIAEEYANTGIRIIKKEVIDKGGDPLWNLVDLVRNYQKK